jgi:diadenosine tetraphosphate (Ap4A) HIT family hydrolase
MALLFDSSNFTIESVERPLIDRNDGGHLTINPKVRVSTRQELTPLQAVELTRLTMVAGEAMTNVMNAHGVDIGRINYQDNGNWSVFLPEGPALHVHVYGRAKNARYQKYGEALYFPHRAKHPELYDNLQPLTERDCGAITAEITKLMKEERYSDATWSLKIE